MEFEPMLTPREKSPLWENVPRGVSNPRHCGSEPKHYQLSYSGTDYMYRYLSESWLHYTFEKQSYCVDRCITESQLHHTCARWGGAVHCGHADEEHTAGLQKGHCLLTRSGSVTPLLCSI